MPNSGSWCAEEAGPPILRRHRAQVTSARVGSSAVGDHPATPVWHSNSETSSSPIHPTEADRVHGATRPDDRVHARVAEHRPCGGGQGRDVGHRPNHK